MGRRADACARRTARELGSEFVAFAVSLSGIDRHGPSRNRIEASLETRQYRLPQTRRPVHWISALKQYPLMLPTKAGTNVTTHEHAPSKKTWCQTNTREQYPNILPRHVAERDTS